MGVEASILDGHVIGWPTNLEVGRIPNPGTVQQVIHHARLENRIIVIVKLGWVHGADQLVSLQIPQEFESLCQINRNVHLTESSLTFLDTYGELSKPPTYFQ